MKNRKTDKTDLLEELGTLGFASRLRRLSERLLRDVSTIYESENLNFQARWFPVYYLLWRQSPLAVTVIAQRLHLTHPAVNQVAGAMTKAGLLLSTRDRTDDRRRLLSLSPEGRNMARKLQPIWRDIQEATAELVNTEGIGMLDAVARVEESLDKVSMRERVRARSKKRQLAAVEIVGYQPSLRKEFKRLNLEWLDQYFAVEPADLQVLDDPEGQVIANGGRILFAKLGRQVVGTVALLKHDDTTFELAKMAVTEKARGLQAGKSLALAAIEKARELNASRMILFTSPELVAAVALYRQLGFRTFKVSSADIPFKRPSLAMQLRLEKTQVRNRQRRGR